MHTHWSIYESAPPDFINCLPEHPLLMQVLYNRGLRDRNAASAFLSESDVVVENPFRMAGMTEAVNRIVKAIEKQEVICVYGDFDADGVTATALLTSAIQSAGGQAGPYIPDRVDEGYGLNVDAIERIAAKASLIVTVDCGIRSTVEVDLANRLGLDVIVTDHHSIGPELPDALAVINPRRVDCPSANERLAGVGVAFRLAQGILRVVSHQRWSKITEEQVFELERILLDFVAIGTVADLMPLLEENRSLVQRGLAQLNRTERPGLQALLSFSDMRLGTVDAAAISFRIAPRINAAGRLSQTALAYRLLRTNDPTEAYTLTNQLETLNQERKNMTVAAQTEAELLLLEQREEDQDDLAPIHIVHSPNFKSGIVGLVAGRLTDAYYRPAVVVEEGNLESRGSARSIAEFDISAALDQVSHLLIRHGGHSRAAGFTVETAKLPAFKEALTVVAAEQLAAYKDLCPTLYVDAAVGLEAIDWSLQKQFARLEPTGQGNTAPLLLCRRCRIREVRTVGQGKHLKLALDGGPHTTVLDAVAFRKGEWAKKLSEDTVVDVVCHVEANEWMGRQRLQLNVEDLRLSDHGAVC